MGITSGSSCIAEPAVCFHELPERVLQAVYSTIDKNLQTQSRSPRDTVAFPRNSALEFQ